MRLGDAIDFPYCDIFVQYWSGRLTSFDVTIRRKFEYSVIDGEKEEKIKNSGLTKHDPFLLTGDKHVSFPLGSRAQTA